MKNSIESSYNPKNFEDRMYDLWLKSGHFSPRALREGESPFVIVIPPPNVTGVLHLGHGLNNSLQDILIRYHRMRGEASLWVPGTDHAGIATQHIVEKQLRKKGIEKEDIGREKFLEEVWKLKEDHHAIISEQLRKIGSSCDWSRERFTLDEGLSAAVKRVFIDLYNKGLVYKGKYLVNWSIGVQSAISDDEVEFKDVQGFMYRIRYPLVNGTGHIEIATTRPETLFGDTAVAVHPQDERYTEMIGKMLRLPLTEREIPIIADSAVNAEFGTGAVKITPAHDFNDYSTGLRNNLPIINIMNPNGSLNSEVPFKYQGLSMAQARKAAVSDLEEQELLIAQDPYTHQVGHCYRSGTIIEPYLSTQWFVKMKPLAEKALSALRSGDIRFIPKRWEKVYVSWMENIQDWCISRQLWWGHRIPVWYNTQTGEAVASMENPAGNAGTTEPEKAGEGGATGMAASSPQFVQDENVLDTWFSSWLWPFSVFGWPENTEDLKNFFPTTSLVSGHDIIFFWVARMVMASMEFLAKAPFRDIYMTGLVLDKKGQKMSKTLGNGVDPLEIVEENGADALRFTLAFLCTQGQNMRVDKQSFALGSRFANKIWNATRYVLMNIDAEILPIKQIREGFCGGFKNFDKWILGRLNAASSEVGSALDSYRFNDAASAAYRFFWNEFCDWYIEVSKLGLQSDDPGERKRSSAVIHYILLESLKLLHPLLPFISEELYQILHADVDTTDGDSSDSAQYLIAEKFPQPEEWRNFSPRGIDVLMKLIVSVRTLRSEFNIPPAQKFKLAISVQAPYAAIMHSEEEVIRRFCSIDTLQWINGSATTPESANTVASDSPDSTTSAPSTNLGIDTSDAVAIIDTNFEAHVFLRSLINIEQVSKRFQKSIDKEAKMLGQLRKRLSNAGFLDSASAEIIEANRNKQADLEEKIEKLSGYLQIISG